MRYPYGTLMSLVTIIFLSVESGWEFGKGKTYDGLGLLVGCVLLAVYNGYLIVQLWKVMLTSRRLLEEIRKGFTEEK